MNIASNIATVSAKKVLKPQSGFLLTQRASLSKYISKSRRKRIPLSTKHAGKGYYKGKGARKEGHITSKGHFIMDKEMVTNLVVPDLEGFALKAYVGPGAKRNIIEREVDIRKLQQENLN